MANRLNKNVDIYSIVFLIIIVASLAMRVPGLDRRPMHTDEAVQGIKFGELLEENLYRYNQYEYHGPTLYYFTLIPAWLLGQKNIAGVDEKTLRTVPVFFGFLLIPVLFLFMGGIDKRILLISAALAAVSPSMVFYSRYYIQEMLLTCFTYAAIAFGYRLIISGGKTGWALAAGISVGLMHATKETCALSIGMMIAAALAVFFLETVARREFFSFLSQQMGRTFILVILSALAVSALFYSSFFTNPGGVVDSYRAYFNYFGKAGAHEWHIHPWWYYLKILSFPNGISPMMWGEFFILIFAAPGVFWGLKTPNAGGNNARLVRFFIVFSLGLAVIYSIIPYKTPWLMLSFWPGMILLAAFGIIAVVDRIKTAVPRYLVALIVLCGFIHLTAQSVLLNFRYDSDPVNPYVYAHTSRDIFKIVERVRELAVAQREKNNMYVEVICSGNDYWPLPWYLRDFKNVGWWDHVDMNVPAAPVIIVSPDLEKYVVRKLYELPPPGKKNLYLPLLESITELRPGVELDGYVIKDLWDKAEMLKNE